mgnify:CR=1 FL=1
MPKIRPLTEADRKNQALLGEIAMGMSFARKNNKDMAAALGIKAQTWCRKKKNPGTFTLSELRKIQAILPAAKLVI